MVPSIDQRVVGELVHVAVVVPVGHGSNVGTVGAPVVLYQTIGMVLPADRSGNCDEGADSGIEIGQLATLLVVFVHDEHGEMLALVFVERRASNVLAFLGFIPTHDILVPAGVEDVHGAADGGRSVV